MLLAVALALTLAAAGFAYLTAPQYLPYDETEWMITRSPPSARGRLDHGGRADRSPAALRGISVNLLTPVSGTKVTSTQDPDSGKTVYFITAWRTPLDTWCGTFDVSDTGDHAPRRQTRCWTRSARRSPHARSSRSTPRIRTAIYYSPNNGQDDVLLCGNRDSGIISLPRLASRLLRFAIIGTFYSSEYCLFPLPQEKAGKALGHLALIPACYLTGHLLVKGFVTTSYQMQPAIFRSLSSPPRSFTP